MFTSCSVSELDNTTFVMSVSDTQGRVHIRKDETCPTLFMCRGADAWKTTMPLANLSLILKCLGTSLVANTVFVHPTEYTEYPTEYALHCALHHLPPMWGILKT